VGFEPTTSGL